MQVEIVHRSANTAAKVTLEANEILTTEAGAMIAMSPNLSVETSTHKRGSGGILRAGLRMLAGESFFMNHYTARSTSEIWLAPELPGDITEIDLSGPKLIVQSASFLAADHGIALSVGWQGFRSMLSGESMLWLELRGRGKALLSSFGSVYSVEVDGEYTIDTGHIVAFEEGLSFKISKAGSSWLHSLLGGEGLVCKFSGKGRIWCQSHKPNSFGFSLTPHLRPKKG